MNSRMDKYEIDTPELNSREKRNQKLYSDFETADYDKFDVNSNISVLQNNAREIDVNQIRDMLDRKYRDDIPKRKSIDISFDDTPLRKQAIEDTKEYDLNSVLSKAKDDKVIDYNVERLNNTNNSAELIDKINQKYNQEESKEEKELKELINTITSLELKNQKADAELLDMVDDKDKEKDDSIIEPKIEDDFYTGKLAVTEEDFDDFKDMQKDIKSNSIFIKVLVFIVILVLIAIGIYVLNNIFDLGLFK